MLKIGITLGILLWSSLSMAREAYFTEIQVIILDDATRDRLNLPHLKDTPIAKFLQSWNSLDWESSFKSLTKPTFFDATRTADDWQGWNTRSSAFVQTTAGFWDNITGSGSNFRTQIQGLHSNVSTYQIVPDSNNIIASPHGFAFIKSAGGREFVDHYDFLYTSSWQKFWATGEWRKVDVDPQLLTMSWTGIQYVNLDGVEEVLLGIRGSLKRYALTREMRNKVRKTGVLVVDGAKLRD